MSRFTMLGICFAALLIARSELAPSSAVGTATQKLTVREEAGRVVLAWSGPIAAPMRDDIVAAFDRFKADPRTLVLTLNSPGGSIEQSHAVMTSIRETARLRRIDTRIENGAACASMCVPIYLLGTERTADASGQFMFHEVKLDPSAGQQGEHNALAISALSRKTFETLATDVLYGVDLDGRGVNAHWLHDMRTRIVGHEIWVSARQLVGDHSGVVDALIPAVAK